MQDAEDVCRSHGFESGPDPMLHLMSRCPGMAVTLASRSSWLSCSDLKQMGLSGLSKLYSVSLTNSLLFILPNCVVSCLAPLMVHEETFAACLHCLPLWSLQSHLQTAFCLNL